MDDQARRDDLPILTPEAVLTHRWARSGRPRLEAPTGAILCYQRHVLTAARRRYRLRRVSGFSADVNLIKASLPVALVSGFGVGAPAAAAVLEELIAFGVRRILSIGVAGALHPDLAPGDLILCDRAFPDEGTSAHYLPTSESVAAAPRLVEQLSAWLGAAGHGCRAGTSWTTDAPYRETASEVERRVGQGAMTVEMEASALFAVGQFRGVEVGAAFAIGDTLADGVWRLDADLRATSRGLETLLEAAVGVLASERAEAGR
jgi:uridine phosphorylase